MEGFTDEASAAEYHSSLIGVTTFQSKAVLNSMLRAAAAGQPEAVLFQRRAKVPPPLPPPQPHHLHHPTHP